MSPARRSLEPKTASDRCRDYRKRHPERVRVQTKAAQARHNARKRAQRLEREFVGVDGEGRNLENGYHAYFMFRVGDDCLWPEKTVFGDAVRLKTSDILGYLADQDPDRIYVSYFFNYDVAKILEDLPFERLTRLVNRNSRVRQNGGLWPVDWKGFEFDWLPGKEFKVRRATPKGERPNKWVVVHDTGPFFQCSFLKALTTWDIGTAEERAVIEAGKALRAKFSEQSDEYIDNYNALECRLLAELMDKFRQVCIDVGVIPKKWQGPGQLADVCLEKHGIPRNSELELLADTSEGSLAEFGRSAYYGGWFEAACFGYTLPGCIQWDINSAYPYALLSVPCLSHGGWTRVTGKRTVKSGEISICFGVFKQKPGHKFFYGGFSVRRDNGTIYRPLNGRGWYWSFEIEAAEHQEFTTFDSWVYERQCDCQPFAFAAEYYAERKRIGKDAMGLVLKLLLNSLYGKLTQSVGRPKYANPVWASYITAHCRTIIGKMLHTLPACKRGICGDDVYMIATDALITGPYEPSQVPALQMQVGDALGQFSREVHPNGLFIVQPGVYFDPIGDSAAIYKTRGVPKDTIIEHRQSFLDGYERVVDSQDIRVGDVHLPYTLMVGIRLALQRRNTKLMGQFIEFKDPVTGEMGRRVSFNFRSKRRTVLPGEGALVPGGPKPRRIRTVPYKGWEGEEGEPVDKPGYLIQTKPYDRDIGALKTSSMLRMMFDSQPDGGAESPVDIVQNE